MTTRSTINAFQTIIRGNQDSIGMFIYTGIFERLPSEYFRENVHMTFQDDWTAFKYRDGVNVERLMSGNDFPHSDATWPQSPTLPKEHTADMTE